MFDVRLEDYDPRDFRAQIISIGGTPFAADQSGALYWLGRRTLVVADMHLEKGSSFARRGCLLPPYDTRKTLLKLAAAIYRYDATTVIALGDSLHELGAEQRMAAGDLALLRAMQEGRRWIWVTGNHDPLIPEILGGETTAVVEMDGLALRHEPSARSLGHEIAGHLHPAARVSMYGSCVRRPCFISNGKRLVMPAFGAYTGGLNILDEIFAPLFGDDPLAVWAVGDNGVFPVNSGSLRID